MVRLHTASLDLLHWVAIGLAAIVGLVQIAVGTLAADDPLGIALALGGLGLFAWILLVVLGYSRRLLTLAAIPYAVVQILLWWTLSDLEVGNLLEPGLVVAALQLALLVILVWLYEAIR